MGIQDARHTGVSREGAARGGRRTERITKPGRATFAWCRGQGATGSRAVTDGGADGCRVALGAVSLGARPRCEPSWWVLVQPFLSRKACPQGSLWTLSVELERGPGSGVGALWAL